MPRCISAGSAKSAAATWGLMSQNQNLINCETKSVTNGLDKRCRIWLNPQKLYNTALLSRLGLDHVPNIQWVPQIPPVSPSFKAMGWPRSPSNRKRGRKS